MAALAVLWSQRPALPELPNSLSSPVTTGLLRELVFIAAWLLTGVVVFLLLVHVVRVYVVQASRTRTQALRPGVVPAMRDRSFAHAGLVAGAARPAFAAPFPLILLSLIHI